MYGIFFCFLMLFDLVVSIDTDPGLVSWPQDVRSRFYSEPLQYRTIGELTAPKATDSIVCILPSSAVTTTPFLYIRAPPASVQNFTCLIPTDTNWESESGRNSTTKIRSGCPALLHTLDPAAETPPLLHLITVLLWPEWIFLHHFTAFYWLEISVFERGTFIKRYFLNQLSNQNSRPLCSGVTQ